MKFTLKLFIFFCLFSPVFNAGAQVQYDWTSAGIKSKPKKVIQKHYLGEGNGKRLSEIATSEYDRNGKVSSKTLTYSFEGNSGIKTLYNYKNGKLANMISYQLADTATRDTVWVSYSKNKKEALVEYRDVQGNKLKSELHIFDTAGREIELKALAETRKYVVTYKYNKAGMLVKITRSKPENPLDGTSRPEDETYTYDAKGFVSNYIGISSHGLKLVTKTEYPTIDKKGNWTTKIERTESIVIKDNSHLTGDRAEVFEREIVYY